MSAAEFEVQRNIPLPVRKREYPYPFDKMSKGDSFSFTSNECNAEQMYSMAVYWSMRELCRRRWSVRRIKYDATTGVMYFRIWRVA